MTWRERWNRYILLRHLAEGLNSEESRALRITNGIHLTFGVLLSLLWPQVLINEPPETHFTSQVLFIEIMFFLGLGRIFLLYRQLLVGCALSLLGLIIHITGLCIAFPDDPAHTGFYLLMILPFLTIPSQYPFIRWSFIVLSFGLYMADQIYFKTMNGPAIFGRAKWIVTADYYMPPMILINIFFLILINSFVKAVRGAEESLAREHAASEKLLLNILPEEIAKELKTSGSSEPRYFPETTVCFTDFVGFTGIAESMSPTDLVKELDQCFSYFDSVIERNHLEKLKTIGDSYMFVGGVPLASPTHAVDSVLAALEIQSFMEQMKEIKASQGLPYWELRLGIHSGDLVAGVIGEKKFAYDVWSDTVNTASRCESSGVPGRINISAATYALVKDFFQCEFRGAVPAKNKGNLDMYFVSGIHPGLHRENEPRVPNEKFAGMVAELKNRKI